MAAFEIESKNINYYIAGNKYSAQFGGMRYKIYKEDISKAEKDGEQQQEKPKIIAALWPCPWCIEKTEDDLKMYNKFELSEEGLTEAENWIKQEYENNESHWQTYNTGRLF